MSNVVSADALQQYVGKETGVSEWFLIDQDRVNKFAEATEDYQYIHVDSVRAAQTPFGGSIAHGFLTLSLLSKLGSMDGSIKLKNAVMGINYGLDKVRFITPVRVGKRIRARFELVSAKEKKPGHFLLKHNVTVEIEGEPRPAMIAEWLGMTVLGSL
ncbi:MAG: MaoC family dehydratase [Pseudohongiellaceae bacterium]